MTTIVNIKPWACEAECDAPRCRNRVDFAIRFDGAPTPGLSMLYLCEKHADETKRNYASVTEGATSMSAIESFFVVKVPLDAATEQALASRVASTVARLALERPSEAAEISRLIDNLLLRLEIAGAS